MKNSLIKLEVKYTVFKSESSVSMLNRKVDSVQGRISELENRLRKLMENNTEKEICERLKTYIGLSGVPERIEIMKERQYFEMIITKFSRIEK